MLSSELIAETNRSTRTIILSGGWLKVITLVGDEQKVYYIEPGDVPAYGDLLNRIYDEGSEE